MEFNTSHRVAASTCLSTDLLTHTLIVSSIFCCASLGHIMFEIDSLITRRKKTVRQKASQIFYCVEIRIENYRPVCILSRFDDLIIRDEAKKENGEGGWTWPLYLHFLFIVIEINKRIWWLIVDTDDRTQMLANQVTLWLLLFDYAYTLDALTQHEKCRAVCAVNSIDYAYNFLFTLSYGT